MLYRGPLYRALNPIYAREPLSGRGAELYGGRFNPKGVPALYSSLTVMTALREANQAGSLQPTTLVSYDADIESVFDCRDEAALKAEGDGCGRACGQHVARSDESDRRSEDASFCSTSDRQRLSWRCWSEASRQARARMISISYSGAGATHLRPSHANR